jgi:hypothetical protein
MMRNTLVWRRLEFHCPSHLRRYAARSHSSRDFRVREPVMAHLHSRLNTVRIGL